jgi:tetratricopeptide (TPR) repeat protein
LGLINTGIAIWETLLSATKNPAKTAGIYNNLSNDLRSFGDKERAFKYIIKAVEIYKRLAETNPQAFEPALAGSLNNLGNCYSNLDQRSEALEAMKRADEIRERLGESDDHR